MQRCGASGLGFKVPEGVCFLDIDHRELSDSLVKKLLKRHNSYTEFSPSGNGIHILGTCDAKKLPIIYDVKKQRNILSSEFYQKNSVIGVELYIGSAINRFATFTGNVINDSPLAEEIDKVFRESNLYRDKWERDDYRESMIALGIEVCHGVFHKSVIEHQKFIRFDERTSKPYISVSLLEKYVREHMQYVLVRDNGRRF